MAKLTITEALAEIKTIKSRIAKKREGIGAYLVRQEKFKDPLEKDGGSRTFIARERQGIADLEQRMVDIRRAIQTANMQETVTLGGTSRSIADWLAWRREVAPDAQKFLNALRSGVNSVRADAARKGVSVTASETGKPDDVIVNVNEILLAAEIDALEETLGALDGQLSLKNATVMVDI